ncbi:MAG: hypothetical protein K2Y22_16895 [Candidatus Obscuribacterales bacterium]|nr:hypothetical protein [Candidatus Obscuribacterales bacterium]
MNERIANESDLPEKLNLSQPIEASDKLAPLTTEGTVTALQDEVIRLRQEGQPDVRKFPKKGTGQPVQTTDSLSGQVQDYTPLIASLAPKAAIDNTTSTQATVPELSTLTANADAQLIATLPPIKPTIPLALQDNLIKTTEQQPEVSVSQAPTNWVSENKPSFQTMVLDAAPEPSGRSSSNLNTHLALSSPSENQSAGTSSAVAFNREVSSFEKAPQTHTEIQKPIVASAPPQKDIAVQNAATPSSLFAGSTQEPMVATRSLDNNLGPFKSNKPVSDAPVIVQTPPTPFAQPALQNTEAPAKMQATNSAPADKALIASLGQPQPDRTPARDAAQSVLPTAEKPIASKEQIALNPSAPLLQAATEARQPEAKPSLVAQESTSPAFKQNILAPNQNVERTHLTANAASADYSLPFKETNRELAKESKDKDMQIAALNYPKFGGAAPVEESAKPIIPQQKAPSSQSSLARDSAPEKAHPLSESFVSGKVLSQPGKDAPTKDSVIDAKSPDAKTNVSGTATGASATKSTESKSIDSKSDSKTPDVKTPDIKTVDAKTGDVKFADAKISEGRLSDPRSLDSTHHPGASIKPGQEIPGTNSPLNPLGQPTSGERVIMSGNQPGKHPDTQVRADGSTSATKADGTSPDAGDKPGKKQDADDKKDIQTGKGPGNTADTGKIQPGSKAFNDLLDFIDKADQADVKPGGKALTPLTGSNILSPDDVLITGTGAIGQGVASAIGDDSKDETADDDKLSHRRKKYIVQEGDTIDSIAEAELGDARFANLILTINQANIASRIQDGKKVAIKLDPGQIIWLPSDHELQVHADIYLLA